MQDDIIRVYADGIIDRLYDEGVTLVEEPVVVAEDGSLSSYLLNLGESGEDNLLAFAEEFAQTNYPNEYGTPSAKAVQILLMNQINPRYKNIGVDLGAIFHYDDQMRPRLTFRILGARYYDGQGNVFESPYISDVMSLATKVENYERIINIPDVGEVGEE